MTPTPQATAMPLAKDYGPQRKHPDDAGGRLRRTSGSFCLKVTGSATTIRPRRQSDASHVARPHQRGELMQVYVEANELLA